MTESVQLDELDQYLSSDESPEDCMMLSDLDGLLHGVICSPSPVSSDVWMAAGLRAEPKELPDWVVNTLTDRYMEIAQGLAHDPMVVEPIFWQAKKGHVIAMDWYAEDEDAIIDHLDKVGSNTLINTLPNEMPIYIAHDKITDKTAEEMAIEN